MQTEKFGKGKFSKEECAEWYERLMAVKNNDEKQHWDIMEYLLQIDAWKDLCDWINTNPELT